MQQTEDDHKPSSDDHNKKGNPFKVLIKLVAFLILLGLLVAGFVFAQVTSLNQAPDNFPSYKQINIEEGTGVREITNILEREGVVRSKNLLYYTLVFLHEPTDIKASTYVFETPLSTVEVAKKLSQGDFDTDLVRFTHFEGERVRQIARRAPEVLPEFNPENFIELAEPLEGKLFPETYFVPNTFTEVQLFELMRDTFNETVAPLQAQIDTHSLTLDEILILASIIEREADTPESKMLVSSVLQNRIEIGMALQADASIEYVLDKPLSELTPADLEIDTPYNTYLYSGLPPTPIGNPGIDAIEAVLLPTQSDYFFYITGNDGAFYFAETYNQHLINIERHLR